MKAKLTRKMFAMLLAFAMVAVFMPVAFAAVSSPADYKVTVGVSTTTDRDTTNEMVDVFAGDQVTVTVTVTEDTFVAADITLTYDTANFELAEEAPTGWSGADPSEDADYPGMSEDGLTPTGVLRYYAANPTQGGSWEDGKILGTFTFTALPGENAVMNVPFKIRAEGEEEYPNAYVAKEWSAGWSSDAATPVDSNNLTNGHANIRLKEMTASVTAETGLSYKGDNTPQKLVKDGYTAKDNSTGAAITDATIKYAVKTKAETEQTSFDAAALVYDTTNPTVNKAGDYVLFYQISRPGFVTVNDRVNVSVAKANVTVTWSFPENITPTNGKAGDGVTPVTTDYYVTYTGENFTNPTATYPNLDNNNAPTSLTVTMTTPENGTMKQTGTYTFKATLPDDYSFTNPTEETRTVLVDGSIITGYTLENTDEGTEEWYDGKAHDVAKLTESTSDKTEGVTVQYSIDGGTTWANEMPKVIEVSKNEVLMKLTADGYYEQIQSVNFEIKNVEYKVEKTDWVTGWDMVLVYTNDTVPGFKYDGKMMYNLSNMANKYAHDTGTYTYVYGLVVNGDANITLVVPSNEAATAIDYNGTAEGTGAQSSQYDVNSSNNVDINDLVAVQGIYNVDSLYMNNQQMSVVCRADVNRDKKVDTMDCSQIKLNSNK